MSTEALIKRLKRSLKKGGLTLVTTRRDSRDFCQMGRYAVIDGRRMLIHADVDLLELAYQRGLIKPDKHKHTPVM